MFAHQPLFLPLYSCRFVNTHRGTRIDVWGEGVDKKRQNAILKKNAKPAVSKLNEKLCVFLLVCKILVGNTSTAMGILANFDQLHSSNLQITGKVPVLKDSALQWCLCLHQEFCFSLGFVHMAFISTNRHMYSRLNHISALDTSNIVSNQNRISAVVFCLSSFFQEKLKQRR